MCSLPHPHLESIRLCGNQSVPSSPTHWQDLERSLHHSRQYLPNEQTGSTGFVCHTHLATRAEPIPSKRYRSKSVFQNIWVHTYFLNNYHARYFCLTFFIGHQSIGDDCKRISIITGIK